MTEKREIIIGISFLASLNRLRKTITFSVSCKLCKSDCKMRETLEKLENIISFYHLPAHSIMLFLTVSTRHTYILFSTFHLVVSRLFFLFLVCFCHSAICLNCLWYARSSSDEYWFSPESRDRNTISLLTFLATLSRPPHAHTQEFIQVHDTWLCRSVIWS